MPHLPAAILILIDQPHPDKQKKIASAAAVAAQLRPITICHRWQDCLSLITDALIGTVFTALDPGPDVRSALEAAGGRLVVARESKVSIHRSLARLVMRLVGLGIKDPKAIAEALEVSTHDVRRSLEQFRKPQDDLTESE